ncbi:HAD family hydrolase [Bacillus sp. RO3]|nr:HAD family hydrolase [Bacillus sp. RO3]
MNGYKAILFDLDDTLIDRDKAVENLFFILVEKCYEEVSHSKKTEMLKRFKEHDRKSYGYSDKTNVLDSFFDDFPPSHRLPSDSIQDFWNHHFPQCFSVNKLMIAVLNEIKSQVKVGIITNGTTERQTAKIKNTHLYRCFETIIISEDVGLTKPDKRIFELALNELNVKPEETLFVGDDLEKDMEGCQNANIKGIWFNPHRIRNGTGIKPYAEIHSFDRLLEYVT